MKGFCVIESPAGGDVIIPERYDKERSHEGVLEENHIADCGGTAAVFDFQSDIHGKRFD